MPRNMTGGSGHKSQRNSEGSKARANRELVNDLLDESDFGRRRVVPMEDVDEIDLEDPETGRVFGSVDIHRPTGREIVWDGDGNARVCLTCPSGGGSCWLCCPPPPRSERIFSVEDTALLAQFM